MNNPDDPADAPTVDIAIVNWNTAEEALEAARGFLASTGARVRVTVIDNSSTEDQQRKLAESMPGDVKTIFSGVNLGFGAGANLALRGGDSEFICVSNADVVPDPGAIGALAGFCRDHPGSGMVGPAFTEDSGYHSELPSAMALAVRPLIGSFGRRSVRSPLDGEAVEVGQPAGACFLVRREVWARFGGFDEDFFLWYEDVDLAKRLHEAGLRNYVFGGAMVRHAEGLATARMSASDHQATRLEGLRIYTGKHHPLTARLASPIAALAARLRVRGGQAGKLA